MNDTKIYSSSRKNKISIRKIIAILSVLIFIIPVNESFSQQIPEGFNYQGVARDDSGYPIADKDIIVEISIYAGIPDNDLLKWQEIHELKTNEAGFFSLVIGEGISTHLGGTLNSFLEIDWANDEYYMEVQVDFGAADFGHGLIPMGVAKLQSVPYSFWSRNTQYADTAYAVKGLTLHNLIGADEPNEEGVGVVWQGGKWDVGVVGGISGDYVKIDGTSDLTGDWTISNNNIVLQNGSITANTVNSQALKLGTTAQVNGISTDALLGGDLPNDNSLVTQNAIKSYVDSKITAGSWVSTDDYLYNIDKKIGIGTSTPISKFHADISTDAFLVTGNHDVTTHIGNLGSGTRMAFYPSKAAFRAGTVGEGVSYWDDANVGEYSVAFGNNTLASGRYSSAFGISAQAIGSHSFAVGRDVEASSGGSVAMGRNTIAENVNAVAINFGTKASGEHSFAIGEGTIAEAIGSFAGGKSTLAKGDYSMAFGNETITGNMGNYSLAFGGNSTETKAEYSVAFGYGTIARTFTEVVIGQYNTKYEGAQFESYFDWYPSDRVFVIGNGIGSAVDDRSDAVVVLKNGNFGIGESTPTSKLVVNGNIVATGSVSQSDIRYKKNITNLNSSLSKVNNLRGVSYYWTQEDFPKKDFSDKKQIGFIAQEVEKMFPELVFTDKMGYKSVDYAKMTAVLVEAIKEQQKQIEQLQKENTNLKVSAEANAGMNKKLEDMQKQIDTLMQLIN